MGVIKASEEKKDTGPKCPVDFVGVFEKYRELKFIQRDAGDSIRLYARDMLTWQDLNAYKAATGREINMLDAEIIMGLDAIFEGREDG